MTAITGLRTDQIRVAVSGHIYVNTVGTAAPTDTTTPLSTWSDLGYTTDAGVTISKKDTWDTVDLWQTMVPGRYVPKGRDLTIKFELAQVNGITLPLWGGGGTTAPNGATAGEYTYDIVSTVVAFERAMVIEYTDNVGSVVNRFWVPRAMVTETTDLTLSRAKNIPLGLTFGVMQDSLGSPLVRVIGKDANLAP